MESMSATFKMQSEIIPNCHSYIGEFDGDKNILLDGVFTYEELIEIAAMPKVKLYEAARELHRLQIALEHGCKSWGEYAEMRRVETESFYINTLGCKEG